MPVTRPLALRLGGLDKEKGGWLINTKFKHVMGIAFLDKVRVRALP